MTSPFHLRNMARFPGKLRNEGGRRASVFQNITLPAVVFMCRASCGFAQVVRPCAARLLSAAVNKLRSFFLRPSPPRGRWKQPRRFPLPSIPKPPVLARPLWTGSDETKQELSCVEIMNEKGQALNRLPLSL